MCGQSSRPHTQLKKGFYTVPTEKSNATAVQTPPQPDLMQQAAQSTANLGWLQDYILDWRTCRSFAIRIANKQNQQVRKDEEAYSILLGFIAFATNKCEALEEAYQKRYSAHERLMIRLNEEISRD